MRHNLSIFRRGVANEKQQNQTICILQIYVWVWVGVSVRANLMYCLEQYFFPFQANKMTPQKWHIYLAKAREKNLKKQQINKQMSCRSNTMNQSGESR